MQTLNSANSASPTKQALRPEGLYAGGERRQVHRVLVINEDGVFDRSNDGNDPGNPLFLSQNEGNLIILSEIARLPQILHLRTTNPEQTLNSTNSASPTNRALFPAGSHADGERRLMPRVLV